MTTGPAPASCMLGLLLASLGLFAWGLDWGLPSDASWAPDEIVPREVIDGARQSFAGGWHGKYPPLHYYVLAAIYRPLGAAQLDALGPPAPGLQLTLARAGRITSLIMALATLALVFHLGRTLAGPGAGLLAAALVATQPVFAFYAKLANLDVPYLFWWVLSLVFLQRALAGHRLSDYLLLAVTAAAAIGTKDQSYALYVLVPPLLALGRYHREGDTGDRARWLRAIASREMLLAGLAGGVTLLVIYNVWANAEGVRAHFALITGTASRNFREFEPTLAGQLRLAASTVRHLALVAGLPVLLAGLLGLAVAARERAWRMLWLVVPIVSFHLFFSAVVLYVYDRFLLPAGIVIALAAAWLAAREWARPGARGVATRAAVLLTLAWGVGRVVSLDAQMAHDARYEVERWLRAEAAGGWVAAIGPAEYLPRLDGLNARPLGSVRQLERVRPALVVVNADYALRAQPGGREDALYRALAHGSAGYDEALRRRWTASWLLLRCSDFVERTGTEARSNMGKVNPEIRVYRATADSSPPAPDPDR